MTFELFGFDFMPKDNLYGIWVFGFKTEGYLRHLFSIYFAENNLLIDFCFIRIWGG